ncbi:hypothetical protein JHK86_031886 [Glycine max]|nr:hypothetical protein JHK86_031886 [Glycine max]
MKKKNKEKAQQWEKCSQVEIQQESILQVNTPPHQLIAKEERHGKHEKVIRSRDKEKTHHPEDSELSNEYILTPYGHMNILAFLTLPALPRCTRLKPLLVVRHKPLYSHEASVSVTLGKVWEGEEGTSMFSRHMGYMPSPSEGYTPSPLEGCTSSPSEVYTPSPSEAYMSSPSEG